MTRAGIRHLQEMKQLQSVSLVGTKMTEAGLAKLKKALPRTDILK